MSIEISDIGYIIDKSNRYNRLQPCSPEVKHISEISTTPDSESKALRSHLASFHKEDLLDLLTMMYIGRALSTENLEWNGQQTFDDQRKELAGQFASADRNDAIQQIASKIPNLSWYLGTWLNREDYAKTSI